MQVASLELSRTLFELSGWDDTEKTYAGFSNVPDEDVELTNSTNPLFGHDIYKIAPAYDAGYLLRKLPYKVYDDYSAWVYGFKLMPTASTGWKIWYGEVGTDTEMYFNSADTPEDALTLLAIELFKLGILPTNKDKDGL